MDTQRSHVVAALPHYDIGQPIGQGAFGDFGIAKLFAGTDASASKDVVGTPR